MQKTSFQLAKHSILGACIATIISGQASAQEKPIEEIVVEGFRSSLLKSKDLKRDAIGTRDSIVAEDIADFPDLNLAEALQRVPGVTITRDGGEGRRIAIRGLDSNFSLVQLNGMDVLGNTDTAMDSRDQGSRDRAFDFNLFASELFNRIDVAKSYSASDDEGGMAGNVSLRTAKPFDKEGFNSALSVQAGDNEYTDDIAPRTAFLISNTWGNWGALGSIAYSERDTIEQGPNTYRWRTTARRGLGDTIIGENVSDSDLQALQEGTVIAPRGNRLSVWENTQERLGITTAFQYKGDVFDVTLDALYGELNNDRGEYHINPRNNNGSMPYGSDVTMSNVNLRALPTNDAGITHEVLGADFSNSVFNVESRAQDVETTFEQVVLSGNFNLNQYVTLHGLIGYESSELETYSLKVYTETRGDFRYDYSDIMSPRFTYGQDMTDPSQFWLQEIDVRKRFNKTENSTAKFSADIALDDRDTLRVGVAAKQLENSTAQGDQNNRLRDLQGDDFGGAFGDLADIAAGIDDDLFRVQSNNDQLDWAVVNPRQFVNSTYVQNALARTGQSLDVATTLGDSVNGVEEETLNAFIEYEWQRDIGSMALRGNVGLRYYTTDTDTQVSDEDGNFIGSIDNTYDGVLPALNVSLEPTDDIVLRLSLSQNITRPSYSSLSDELEIEVDNDDVTMESANPTLDPYLSTNFDLGAEWYFADNAGYVALAFYRKDIEDYIVTLDRTVSLAETGINLDTLRALSGDNSITLDTPVNVQRPVNAEDATLEGVEFTLQRDFDFLPEPFNNLGMMGNFTYADGEVNYYPNGETLETAAFPNLSEHSSNVTLYYETDNWGVRVAQSYRGSYIQRTSDGSDEEFRGFKPTTFFDMSAFYQVNDQLKITLEGSNLTNEADQQYSSKAGFQRAYNITNSGRTIYLGASYQF
ncbi:TonB-dependent receptor [Marinibactrum halimedae]|uniref:TonB-dependent receptor n=1 Tax=Marinibactrum halimedae TaxID=1444977 RepID=A0AA37T841_9GAMM|nr:TonB-dependent receptor [Marinibactrum halimedae]MCD9458580.1 TonB-dependent receptor [Marinibactrum halimedae]GLS26552.1 TonB-dependent receptor [Marinibactrum halimedae]